MVGRGSDAAERLRHDGLHRDLVELGLVTELDATQLQQVVDRAPGAIRLDDHPLRQTFDDLAVGFVADRLREEAERPDGCLQFMADVGDEVAPDGLGPTLQGTVLDDGQATDSGRSAEGLSGDHERLGRRTEQFDLTTGRPPGDRFGEKLSEGGLDEHQAVTRLGVPAGHAVAEQVRAVLVADHHTLFDVIDRLAEAFEQVLAQRVSHGGARHRRWLADRRRCCPLDRNPGWRLGTSGASARRVRDDDGGKRHEQRDHHDDDGHDRVPQIICP